LKNSQRITLDNRESSLWSDSRYQDPFSASYAFPQSGTFGFRKLTRANPKKPKEPDFNHR